MAPYRTIPRDYLSDTPLLHAMGFLVFQHGQLGAIPPPPFLSVSPVESMRSEGAIPPPPKGYLSDTCAIPYENTANGCDTPLCDTISKGYCAIWGGISHWAARSLAFLEKKQLPLRPQSFKRNPQHMIFSEVINAVIATNFGTLCIRVGQDGTFSPPSSSPRPNLFDYCTDEIWHDLTL